MKERFIRTVERLKKMQVLEEFGEMEEVRSDILEDKYLKTIHKNLQDDNFLVKKFVEYQCYSSSDAYQGFVAIIKKKRVRKKIILLSSAAAIFILFLGIVWLCENFSFHPQQKKVMTSVEKNVILAGSSKAQLTLANGEVINMGKDSMNVRTGEGIEINYTGGMISYKNTRDMTELVYNCLTIPIGGECHIVLEDGTSVWMNADSKLTYPVKFVGEERVVQLEGEAYFEVTKGKTPFIVRTARGKVRVHGTSFNVKSYAGERDAFTTLVSGKISYEYANQIIELNPGEQVIVSCNGKLEKRSVNTLEYVGWKDGLYIFKKCSLESIMTELARWYDVEVVYQDETLKNIAFTGNLERYDTINAFLKILKRSGEVNYQVKGKTIILFK